MRVLGFLFRVLLLIAIFVGVGFWSAHAVIARSVARGMPEYDVRLAGYMAGLFIGGSVVTVVGVGMLVAGRSKRR